jgi:hypothetical protein
LGAAQWRQPQAWGYTNARGSSLPRLAERVAFRSTFHGLRDGLIVSARF